MNVVQMDVVAGSDAFQCDDLDIRRNAQVLDASQTRRLVRARNLLLAESSLDGQHQKASLAMLHIITHHSRTHLALESFPLNVKYRSANGFIYIL